MIRVLVKASSSISKAGLESLLLAHPGFQLVADSPGEPVGMSPPDILVVETESLEDAPAREAVAWASAGGPVVLLARNPAAEEITEALRAGVRAVFSSSMTELEIVAGIEAAAAGLIVLDGPGVEALLRTSNVLPHRAGEALVETLTPRESDVLRLLASGLGNKEIASRLEISEHTVKFHVGSILGKLRASSRTEAVTLGIRHGLIMI